MFVQIRRGVVPLALVVALLAVACGSDDDSGTSGSASPSPTAEATGDRPPTPEPTGEPTADPTSTPTSEPAAEIPSPSEDPQDFDAAGLEALLPRVPEIVEPPDVGAAPDAELQLQNMFGRVVGTLVGSPLSDAATSGAVTENWMPELVPDLLIGLFAIDATVTANVMADIQAHAEAGAAAGYGDEPSRYFADRAVAARNLRDGNVLVVETLTAISGLDIDERRCAAAALVGGPDECEEGEAAGLLEPVFEISLSELELPDDADDDITDEALCAAWDAAVERLRLDDDTLLRLELAVDDSLADTRFLNRSECRYLADLGEDVEPDPTPALEALESVYSEAIDTVLAAGGVPDDGGDDVPLEYDPALLELEAASLWSAATAASLAYREVDEPTARLHLMILVDLGASSAALDAGLAEIDRRVVGLGPDALACWFEVPREEITTCEPALEPLLAETDALYGAFLDEHGFDRIRWDAFDDVYEARCEVWSDTARSRPDADLAVLDRAVEFLATFAVDLDVRSCDSLE